MALVLYTENPKVTDTFLLEVTTPDENDCLTDNPYKVDRLTVYFVERDFLGQNFGEYTKEFVDPALQAKLTAAQEALCAAPDADKLAKVTEILAEIESRSQKTTFYYKERVAVHVVGNPSFPAWLSTDEENSPLTQAVDENGDPILGKFTYEWNPAGSIREGDYFLCWTWTPNPAGESLSAHVQFRVDGDPSAVMTIPTHLAPTDKYETLLERYLPDMYKQYIADNDETPETLDKFNSSVALGFTFVENMANQIIDLFDANALHESLLVYQSNFFNLKLKSDDPTLWRRQIKEAVPLFKKKGTLPGLQDAFAQAGMTLNKFIQFWQIVSPYTWVDEFTAKDSLVFDLSKNNIVLPLDLDNFGLWIKRAGETDYEEVSDTYVSFDTADDGVVRMTWVAGNLSSNAVDLFEGDKIKVMYQYREIPDNPTQQIEDYIRLLPLADQRDENAQDYPLKNWNVRLIDEDDPMFDVLIPVRHPFQDPLIFGWLRTEFAYSENIYNMEEYNGSTRPSPDPCDIDKNFIDPCGACLSSIYSVDIGVEQLSNDRMLEAQEILREYVPFHAQVHTINFTGDVNEFVTPPVESISMLVAIDKSQYVLSGQSNPIFHRNMPGGLEYAIIDREMLTDQMTVVSGQTGTAFNTDIIFSAPDHPLEKIGFTQVYNVLEVFAPSGNAGVYDLSLYVGEHSATVNGVSEPVDETAFTFRLSNIVYQNGYSSIEQDDLFALSDASLAYDLLSVRSNWDVANSPDYSGGPWTVSIPAYSATPYEINNVADGVIYLKGDANLPTSTTTGITYTLLDDSSQTVESSTTGELNVTRRGYVDLNDGVIQDIHEYVQVGDYIYYDGDEYYVSEFDGFNFWIIGYTAGAASGVHVEVRRRLIEEGIGYFGYRGLNLTTASDHEAGLGMINGTNPPAEDDQTDDSHFKENFLFLIDGEYYKIVSIDGTNVVLNGRPQNWTTDDNGGTSVEYDIVHFPAKEVNVGFIVFDQLNRNGKDPIIREVYSTIDQNTAITALSASPSSGLDEHVSHNEGISFTIERRNGDIYEGEL
jgi:hypothetical protein